MSVEIVDIQYYIPRNNYSVDRLVNSDYGKKIIKKTGINKKYKSGIDEFAVDLAIKSVAKLNKKNKLLNIDYLIFCTQSPEHILPGGASKIQNIFFYKKKIPSIDVSMGCSGFVYSYSLAQSLINSGIAKKVLVVTADTYSKFIDIKDHKNLSIFGDGSSATIVQKSAMKFNSRYVQGTDGDGYKDLYVSNYALRKEKNLPKHHLPKKLFMDGYKIFQFTISKIPNVIKETLKINKVSENNLSKVILHQANKNIIESVSKLSKIHSDKFIYELGNGNTTSSSIPIALKKSVKKKLIKKNDLILICGFGVGLSWSSTILKINKLIISK